MSCLLFRSWRLSVLHGKSGTSTKVNTGRGSCLVHVESENTFLLLPGNLGPWNVLPKKMKGRHNLPISTWVKCTPAEWLDFRCHELTQSLELGPWGSQWIQSSRNKTRVRERWQDKRDSKQIYRNTRKIKLRARITWRNIRIRNWIHSRQNENILRYADTQRAYPSIHSHTLTKSVSKEWFHQVTMQASAKNNIGWMSSLIHRKVTVKWLWPHINFFFFAILK